MASNRFMFILNVDTITLDGRIGVIPVTRAMATIPKNSTRIEDLFQSTPYTLLDPNKKPKRWTFTMKEHLKNGGATTNPTSFDKCMWCHYPIMKHPDFKILRCPIRLVEERERVKYYSYTNKKEVEVLGEVIGRYYLGEKVFGNWSCVLGYAEDNKTRILNRESVQLTHQGYKESGGVGTLRAAPPFTTRKDYNGFLTEEEYFKSCTPIGSDTYRSVSNYYVRIVPIGELFEVSSKF
jgi:hypothetical protein